MPVSFLLHALQVVYAESFKDVGDIVFESPIVNHVLLPAGVTGDDSASDWSTESPTWSEDELEAELDLTTPLAEQGVVIEPHGAEIVRCVCEVQEENDFMIQVRQYRRQRDVNSVNCVRFCRLTVLHGHCDPVNIAVNSTE